MNATILLHAKRIGYACVLNLLAEIIAYCNWNWAKISEIYKDWKQLTTVEGNSLFHT